MTHTLADGCCSVVTPCSHQCKDPTTICDTCRAASPSVAAWLALEERNARASSAGLKSGDPSEIWARAQSAAFKRAHAYAAARPDRSLGPTPMRLGDPTRLPMMPDIADADLAYLAGLAISSKDATLARIAAALLLAR